MDEKKLFEESYLEAVQKGKEGIGHTGTIVWQEAIKEHAEMMFREYGMVPDVIDEAGISYKPGVKRDVASFEERFRRAKQEEAQE